MEDICAKIHDKLREEGHVVNFYDIFRIIELYTFEMLDYEGEMQNDG